MYAKWLTDRLDEDSALVNGINELFVFRFGSSIAQLYSHKNSGYLNFVIDFLSSYILKHWRT